MWKLETSNTDRDIDLSDISSLRLFSTKRDVQSTLSSVDPQAQYTTNVQADFEPVLDIQTPQPLNSKLYVIDFLVEVENFTEVFNVNLLESDSFYKDYVEEKTYILSSLTTLNILGSILLEYSEFTEIDYTYSYSFSEPQTFNIDVVNVNGLLFYPGQFTFDGTTLLVTASKCCGPQEGDVFDISISYGEEDSSTIYDVFLFDFSAEDIDLVDSLSWNNTQFQLSSEITANTLLFNRVKKLAIGIRRN